MGALRLKEMQPKQRLFIHSESTRRTIKPKKVQRNITHLSFNFCDVSCQNRPL